MVDIAQFYVYMKILYFFSPHLHIQVVMDFVVQGKYLRFQFAKIGRVIELHSTRLSHKELLNICALESPSKSCKIFCVIMCSYTYLYMNYYYKHK